jgi:gamma-glutamyltranspeptidase/glutathione hydrolase
MPAMPVIASSLSPNLSLKRTVRKPSTRSRKGIVVTQHRIASEVGARVLKEGGHAVDAAIAAAFAVGVVEPWMSGIGGVGAIQIYEAKTGKITALDFGARSPKRLKVEDFPLAGGVDEGNLFGWPAVKGNINTTGAKAIVAPTEPAGMAMAHKLFGRKTWRDLVRPAADLAEQGMTVDWYTLAMIATATSDLLKDPGARARYLNKDGLPRAPVAAQAGLAAPRIKAEALARTLRAIADEGAGVLYKGALARSIAEDVQALGGYLAEDDLAAVTVRQVETLKFSYRDRTLSVLPELNGGPTLAVAFADLVKRGGTPTGTTPDGDRFVAYGKALDVAWTDRFKRMGDAGERSVPTSTTHLSVIDRDGNMVTLTQTLLSLFGSKVVLPTSGILMNNGINWFDPRPGGPNGLAPDRRGLANYVPTIMTGGGEAIAIGGCGGRRIIPAIFQLLAMTADFGMDLDTSFHTPRIDVSGGEGVTTDRRLPAATREALAREFRVIESEPTPLNMAFTIAGAVRRKGEDNEGATEPEIPWSEAVSEDDVS